MLFDYSCTQLTAVRSPLPLSTAPAAPLLSVIMPVFNERATIDGSLRRVLAAPYSKQVIVVNDGSRDGTSEVLDAWAQVTNIEVLTHEVNRGKGAAIRTGLERAMGRFTIIQDADLEYCPEEYSLLVEPLLSGQADVVFGSRYLKRAGRVRHPMDMFRAGVHLLNACVWVLYGARLSDEATCYKAMPTALLRAMKLECIHFEFCPEVTAKICRMGKSIYEVPITYRPRNRSEGKKIRLSDGCQALLTLWKCRKWRPVPVDGETCGTVSSTQ
jgi:dolichol-phosphate mannosyltransferase